MLNFERLTVNQKALEFTLVIYKISKNWPKEEQFGITSQIRRCSLSIALNIAEGSSRSKKEYLHFLDIARGSAYESIPILYLAQKLTIISEKDYQKCYDDVIELTKMVSGLRNSLKNS